MIEKKSFISSGWGLILLLGILFSGGVLSPSFASESAFSSGFDADEEVFVDEGSFSEIPGVSASENEENDYFNDFKFTASYLYSYGTKAPDTGTINNNVALRCELDKTVFDSFFIKFDGEVYGFIKGDHIAEAGGKHFKSDGKIRKFYVQKAFDRWLVSAGKQIIVWGETDGGVINDVVSPGTDPNFFLLISRTQGRGNTSPLLISTRISGRFYFLLPENLFQMKCPKTARGMTGRWPTSISSITKKHFRTGNSGLNGKKS